MDYKSTDAGVLVWRWILNGPPITLFAKYGNFKGNVDRWHYYDYIAPYIGVIDFSSADAGVTVDLDDRSKGPANIFVSLPDAGRRAFMP